MTFKELDKHLVVSESQKLFLETLPLAEIDNLHIRNICKEYRDRTHNIELTEYTKLFEDYFDYFYKWAYNNWMTDVFYFQR